ncbi:aspartic peptidase domain-containing protein [Epithele typhae]|uniref:aspartic peptidase domain-containing protein n=1 Tax=Epithele typhae TaxID=378194 RepID=UPI00200860E3|nr:aspartic peptidase domain-containing protein [Epithele typhae]KAH9912355.1 aspartic peptidase domain-containing protein [Epithele typhae]
MLPTSFLQLAQFLLPLSISASAALASDSSHSSHFQVSTYGSGLTYSAASESEDGATVVSTGDNNFYTVNITLGGVDFVVLLDTGSSDLWVNTTGRDLQLTNTTDVKINVGYGIGSVSGYAAFADMTLGDFKIPSQIFINPTEITDFNTSDKHDGIMGMAFDSSSIYNTVSRVWGVEAANELATSPITSLFADNPTAPNNFDVKLARTSTLEDKADGIFIISEHDENFQHVTLAPKLPAVNTDHWNIAMDAMLVNGIAFAFNQSRIEGVPDGKVAASLDTGYSHPPLPGPAVDAIYSTIPGAVFLGERGGNSWMVPCDAATNLTFVFGDQEFPVHPLDLTYPYLINMNGKNMTACLNAYKYTFLDPENFIGFDFVLGDSFLRNVYASFDYSDFYPGNNTVSAPFIQLLSTTNASSMWDEFRTERAAALAKLPPAVDPAEAVKYINENLSQSNGTSTTTVAGAAAATSGSSSPSDGSWGQKYGMIALALLGANLLIGLVLLGVTVTMCVRSAKGRREARYQPVRFKEAAGEPDYERGSLKYSD